MTAPCYRCHLREPHCHINCEAYTEWRKAREESRPPVVDITTEAREKKAINTLRRVVKNRADGRGNHEGD